MAKVKMCPHCGSNNITVAGNYYQCKDCTKDFGRPAISDEGKLLKECISDIRFRYGDVISGSVRAHFLQDGEQCVYEIYDSYGGGVDKVADVMSMKEWESFKEALVDKLFVFDWSRVYYPANDGRELRGNNEWELDILISDDEEYIFKGVDAYPAYWNAFLKLLDPYFDKLRK